MYQRFSDQIASSLFSQNSQPIDHMASSIFLFPFTTLTGDCVFSLSQEGLFNLLDSIEGRLHGERTGVYGDSSIDGRQLNRIIRYSLPVFPHTLQSYISPRLNEMLCIFI